MLVLLGAHLGLEPIRMSKANRARGDSSEDPLATVGWVGPWTFNDPPAVMAASELAGDYGFISG
jgi:hypothetical protein